MAEQEVIKHTKKIFGIWKTENNFLHKLSDFLLEIFIIVFAITVSIYFHDQSELRHQRKETKEFLLGLREDLKTDTVEMNDDKDSYIKAGYIFRYITNRKLKESLDADTINKYSNWILNTTGLIPNNGRFEGFKSSGKIGTIENKELQNNIMDLYQEDIPSLITTTNAYVLRKEKLFEYFAVNIKRITDNTSNFLSVLSTDQAYNICIGLSYVGQIIGRYDACISKARSIINEIDKEYGK
jgi:hypothetical protein